MRSNSAAETTGDEGLARVIVSAASLMPASGLLEDELRLGHPFLLAADPHVDEGEDGDCQYSDEHHQPPEDWAGAGERREVGLPDHHDPGRGCDDGYDHVQQRVELGPALGQVVLHYSDVGQDVHQYKADRDRVRPGEEHVAGAPDQNANESDHLYADLQVDC